MLKEYETIFVLDPGQDEAQVEAEITKVSDIITNGGGEIVTVNRWGRRKLAYEIRKKKEGIYTLIQFNGNPEVLQGLGRRYDLLKNETLLRHMTVLYEAPPEVPIVPQAEGFEGAAPAGEAATAAPVEAVAAPVEPVAEAKPASPAETSPAGNE